MMCLNIIYLLLTNVSPPISQEFKQLLTVEYFQIKYPPTILYTRHLPTLSVLFFIAHRQCVLGKCRSNTTISLTLFRSFGFIISSADTMSKVIDLYEFLLEAELHQYYSEFKNDLKASSDDYYLTVLPMFLMVAHRLIFR